MIRFWQSFHSEMLKVELNWSIEFDMTIARRLNWALVPLLKGEGTSKLYRKQVETLTYHCCRVFSRIYVFHLQHLPFLYVCQRVVAFTHRHPNQLEIYKLKKVLIYLAPCVFLFIECDFWVGFHPDPPRNHTQWIKTHKEQDKSSISLIFEFPTDWGACDSP